MKTKISRKHWIILLVVLLGSFAFKMTVWKTVLVTNSVAFLWNDAARYDFAAHAVMQPGMIVAWPGSLENEFGKVPPGYPLFWAGLHLLFDNRDEIVVLTNIFLSLITISLVYAVAKHLFDARMALLASLLVSLDIASFSYSLQAMSEIPFTVFLMTMILAGVCFFTNKSSGSWACLIGVTLAGATLVRAISYYLIVPFLLIVLTWAWLQHQPLKKMFANVGLVLLPFVISVGAVQLYNYTQSGSWGFTTVGGYNMYYYRAAAIVALRDNISLIDARQTFDKELERYCNIHPETRQWNVFQLGDWMMGQGLATVQQYPAQFLKTEINGAIPMMLGGGDGPLLRMLNIPVVTVEDSETFAALKNFEFALLFKRFASSMSLVSFILAVGYLGIIYLGVFFWVARVLLHRQFAVVHLFIWTIILYFVVVSAGPEAGSRFRVPIMPALALYAAGGLGYVSSTVPAKIRNKNVRTNQTGHFTRHR